jgi:hypothetical protein
VCVQTGGWRVWSLGAGRGAVGGGREGGYREEGRKIWFLAQGLDRPSPDVCVCVCGRVVACADGGCAPGCGEGGREGGRLGREGGRFFAVFGEFVQNAPPQLRGGGLARFFQKPCACRVRKGGVEDHCYCKKRACSELQAS